MGDIMYVYYVVHLTKLGKRIYDDAPTIIRDLMRLEHKNDFMKKQLSLLFYSMENEDQRIRSCFQMRKDYRYCDHIHYIHNEITDKDTYCFIKNDVLVLKSHTKSNIFYDILYQSHKNYVILNE